MPLGVPASNFQRAVVPSSFATSRKKCEWGFVRRTSTILPLMEIGTSRLYAAAKEWCAHAGSAASSAKPAATRVDFPGFNAVNFMRFLLRLRMIDSGAIIGHLGRQGQI